LWSWDVQTGNAAALPVKLPHILRQVAFSPDGRRLALLGHPPFMDRGEPPPDGAVNIVDTTTWKPSCPPVVLSNASEARIFFRPDGSLVTANFAKVQVHNTTTGKPVAAPISLGGWIASRRA
jgi:hypothetical protein